MTKTDFLPALFVTPGPQAADAHSLRQRMPERRKASQIIADLQGAGAAKRIRTDAQSVGPPRQTVEDVEDESELQASRTGRDGRQTGNSQSGSWISQALNPASEETNISPGDAVNSHLQGPSGVRSGKISATWKQLIGSDAHAGLGISAARATQSVAPMNNEVDLTGADDDERGNSLHLLLTYRAS